MGSDFGDARFNFNVTLVTLVSFSETVESQLQQLLLPDFGERKLFHGIT